VPSWPNTSTLDVNKIASFTKRPQDVVGTHFFSPANVMKLLEVVRGEKTAKDVLATVMAMGKKIKKTSVVSGVCDGFIGNRMIEQYSRQAGFLLDEGCDAAAGGQGDREVRLRHGPVPHGRPGRQRHRLGHPQAPRHRARRHEVQQDRRPAVRTGPLWPEDRCRLVRLPAGKRDAIPSELVNKMIEDHRKELGITPRKISDEEIVQRLVFSLVNEGAHILEEGIASKASDIDMVYLTGYGFPLHRGGPMCYADQVGLFNVVQAMKRFAAQPAGRREVLAARAAAGQAGR
jgi:3-hydroxyacyl-CoA dehydrogenase